ncbi:CENP-Q, a CENPA-CAD centromere complex subunit-domain-containing protein [Microdochium trichocladiopsis]|uniref:CENP-Q, a CENPA-CAD centromere complex subunit-domain-containing protein n=1 Tax=Microdochium trichocladiopsis TaxID=1682393 RepID=A0A9P9BZC3_9PEZI|nr:CENP-Q, a CENPA-CAD centromere complex subunit-domain-containing protein [Microdochium trichocladiopsis]KAH7039959.1 CENP-Q, a CENPA-CAD centromere complex subunit-domain-containing protein [Microdochium trichocladiopsis]
MIALEQRCGAPHLLEMRSWGRIRPLTQCVLRRDALRMADKIGPKYTAEPPATAKPKRGRPSIDKNKDTTSSEGRKRPRSSLPSDPSATTTTKKKRGRPSAAQAQDSAKEPQTEPEPTRPRKRRRGSGETAEAQPGSDSEGSPPPYRHLESRTRHISRSTIEDKWEPLDKPSIANVTALLGSAARPVLLRLRNMQKHTQATAILNAVGNRLRNKLTRGMPFPPAATAGKREDELEFEKTIAGLEALEYQLDPLLHSVQLLRREKERAEKELEKEYKVLNRLTANARTAARERREHIRKMHGLVPERPSDRADDETAGEESAVPAVDTASSGGNVFVGLDEQDKELASLATQIANHMDSLKGNLRQIDGVVPAIGQSQAALRARLLEHFDTDVVDKVVLG